MTQLNSRKPVGGDVVLESRHLIGLFVVMVVIFGVVFVLGYELGRNQYTQQVHAAANLEDPSATAQPAVNVAPPTSRQPAPSTSSAKQNAGVADQKADSEGQPATNWDFYKAADSSSEPAHLEKPVKAPPPLVATVKSSKTNAIPSLATPKSTAAPSGSIATIKPASANRASNSAASNKPQSLDAPLMPKGTILLQVAALTKQSDALAMAEALERKKFPTIVLPPSADKFFRVQVGPYHDLESAIAARNALENAGFKSIIKR